MNKFFRYIEPYLKPWLIGYSRLELSKQLYMATINDDFEQAKSLLEQGANPNIVKLSKYGGSFKETPLREAIANDNIKIANLLLSHGANPNTLIYFGYEDAISPLQMAVEKHNLILVDLLLKKGTDINAQDTFGRTALHTAQNHGYTDIKELLIIHGADAYIEDNSGYIPEDYILGTKAFALKFFEVSGNIANVGTIKYYPDKDTEADDILHRPFDEITDSVETLNS